MKQITKENIKGSSKNIPRSTRIQLEYSLLKTLEFNGLAERMKWIIMERVQSMLAHAKLSKKF